MKQIIKSLLGMKGHAVSVSQLPKTGLSDFVKLSRPEIKILEPQSVVGNVTIFEVFALSFITAACSPKAIFEIGTFDGRTTLNLAANSPADSSVITLDLPAAGLKETKFVLEDYDKSLVDKPQSGERFQGRPEAAKIKQIYGDSGKFDFSPYYNSMDLVFVDGSHAYDYVLNDSHVALKLLRNKKGIILWHDYDNDCWPGVLRGLDELAKTAEFAGLKHIQDTHIAGLILA